MITAILCQCVQRKSERVDQRLLRITAVTEDLEQQPEPTLGYRRHSALSMLRIDLPDNVPPLYKHTSNALTWHRLRGSAAPYCTIALTGHYSVDHQDLPIPLVNNAAPRQPTPTNTTPRPYPSSPPTSTHPRKNTKRTCSQWAKSWHE